MKTTIDVPDELLHRAKIIAAQRKTTLRELVVQGLDYAIEHPAQTGDPETQRKERASKLLKLLGSIEFAEPIGQWNRNEVYDRQEDK